MDKAKKNGELPSCVKKHFGPLRKITGATWLGAALVFLFSCESFAVCRCPVEGVEGCKPNTKYNCIASTVRPTGECEPIFPGRIGLPECVAQLAHTDMGCGQVNSPGECASKRKSISVPVCKLTPEGCRPEREYTIFVICSPSGEGNGHDGVVVDDNNCSSATTPEECARKSCYYRNILRGADEDDQCSTYVDDSGGCVWVRPAPNAPGTEEVEGLP